MADTSGHTTSSQIKKGGGRDRHKWKHFICEMLTHSGQGSAAPETGAARGWNSWWGMVIGNLSVLFLGFLRIWSQRAKPELIGVCWPSAEGHTGDETQPTLSRPSYEIQHCLLMEQSRDDPKTELRSKSRISNFRAHIKLNHCVALPPCVKSTEPVRLTQMKGIAVGSKKHLCAFSALKKHKPTENLNHRVINAKPDTW
jgi:hypothetical protein